MKRKLGAIILVVALVLALAIPMAAAPVMAADASKLVGHWQFDGNANDRSGYENHGTVYGATYVASPMGQALSFVGSNDYVEVGDAPELRFGDGDSITIEAWVQPAAETPLGVIVQKGGITNHNTNYVLRQAGKKVDFFYRGNDNAWHGFRTDADVLTSLAWAHVAVTYTFGTPASIKIYVNGTSYAVSGVWPGTDDPMENNQTLRFGGLNYWGQKYYGLIDEVRIWSEALPQARLMDTSPPVVTITTPVDGMCYQSIGGAAGSASDANIDASTAFEWSPSPIPTGEGTHTLSLTATDILGYSATTSVTYTIDSTPPVVTITAPEDGAFYLVGMVPAGDYGVVEVNPDTVVESGWSNDGGEHTYTVTATDCAGNVGSDSVTYYAFDGYGTIGGQITQEVGPKKKDWYKISYGGWAGLADGTRYGELEVTFHNVSVPDLDKTKFVATQITYVSIYETGYDEGNDDLPAPPPSDNNKIRFRATGNLVDAATLETIVSGCQIQVDAADTGEPAQKGERETGFEGSLVPDSIRFQISGGGLNYDSDTDFPSPVAFSSRTPIDAGNIQVVGFFPE